jgi:hypothetical protein
MTYLTRDYVSKSIRNLLFNRIPKGSASSYVESVVLETASSFSDSIGAKVEVDNGDNSKIAAYRLEYGDGDFFGLKFIVGEEELSTDVFVPRGSFARVREHSS